MKVMNAWCSTPIRFHVLETVFVFRTWNEDFSWCANMFLVEQKKGYLQQKYKFTKYTNTKPNNFILKSIANIKTYNLHKMIT